MGLEKVKQEIIDLAQKEADTIIESANSEAKTTLKSAEKRALEEEKRLDQELDRAADALKKREAASTELELQKKGLAMKNEIINSVFSDAQKKISQLSDKKRESHIKILLEHADKEIDVATVRCNPKDSKFIDKKLKIIEDKTLSGGIIAESQDGRLRVDYSYETLLAQVKSKVLSDVARKLFEK